ncbi:Gfo/Idh/MocA family oxidoreductase [Chamaesiphon sp. VAR_48_metabat_135_sub]|uniref:Gfo/Idh/MocA family protein n=1 Tax=Chamaesiphon sp. VAR_48_metabat_135_sub TaxID=2964699 RepID=UPI00286CA2E8|nr:Gfo/Idh/MocA family oxidoreductase [Chamaesiphon sp. VAR_48_metabat_135_sub]
MSKIASYGEINLPIRVGVIGTGFAAKVRTQNIVAESRTHLVAVAGRTPERTVEFAESCNALPITDWPTLLQMSDIDLVIVATINGDHGQIVRAAIEAGKHTIVEYPLALNPQEAAEIIELAAAKKLLLHVEHIELLGGLHQMMREQLHHLGEVYYARYSTIVTQRPIPEKWTFHRSEFGFPLSAALSRLHRFTDLFGSIESINCHNRYWGGVGDYYKTCLCTAQLRFKNTNAIGEVIYGKGEGLWQNSRKFEVHGENGALVFDGDEGVLIQSGISTPLDLGARKGLFAKDLELVLDHLIDGQPIYVTPAASLGTLRVADAARISAETRRTVMVDS